MNFQSLIKFLICLIFLPSLISCSNGSNKVAGQIKKYENLQKRIKKLDDLKNYEKKLNLRNKAEKLKYQLVEDIWNNNQIYLHAPLKGFGYTSINSAIYLGKNNRIYKIIRSKKDFKYIGKLDNKVNSNNIGLNSTLLYSFSKSKNIKNAKQICIIQQYLNLSPEKRCLLEKNAYLKMNNLLKIFETNLYFPLDSYPYTTDYSTIETLIISDWEAKNIQTIEDNVPHPFKIVSDDGSKVINIRYSQHELAHQQVVQDFRSKYDKHFKKYPKLWDKINIENSNGLMNNPY